MKTKIDKWFQEKIDYIDDLLQDYIDDMEDDEDIQIFVAKEIDKIIINNKLTENTKINNLIIQDLVESYVNSMFSNWYTGDLEESDYIKSINKFMKK